MITILT